MKRDTTANRLKTLMFERDLKQVDILRAVEPYAQKMGAKMNKSDLSQYVSGKVEPGQDKLKLLSEALNVDVAWLMGFDVSRERQPSSPSVPPGFEAPRFVKKPVLGTIACGTPIYAEQNIEEYRDVLASDKCDFLLICKGDSMAPRLLSGDVVMIRQQPDVEDGQIAAVVIDGEATLKHVYHLPGHSGVQLVADNPAYAPMIFTQENSDSVQIVGLAVAYQRDI